jgi:transposase
MLGSSSRSYSVKTLKEPMFIVIGGHPPHKAKEVTKYIEPMKGRLLVYPLPPYAPDIDPDELVWNRMRHAVHYDFRNTLHRKRIGVSFLKS